MGDETAKTAGAILDRIQQAIDVKGDGDLCRALGLKRSTVGSWRAEDRRPYPLCVWLHETRGISLEWLLTGAGRMTPEDCENHPSQTYAPVSYERRMDALREMLDQLSPESRDAILGDALSRATCQKRLDELDQAVMRIAKTA